MLPIVVAITGASGQPYGKRLVEALIELDQSVYLLVSDAARIVMNTEMGVKVPITGSPVSVLFGKSAGKKVKYFNNNDLAAPVASGSHRTAGMVICPCSTGTLGSVANGVTRNLIERAAEVTLKEKRKLILVPRETPFSTIQLDNMHKLSLAGAVILPAAPGFYNNPEKIDDLVDFIVARILDQLGLEHQVGKRWRNSE
jgi:flavin prenyltransferase